MSPLTHAAITVNIPPSIEIAGLEVSWHGLMIAVGIGVAIWLAAKLADRSGLDRDKVLDIGVVAALGGILGSRLFYLLLNEPGALLQPGEWAAGNGFAIYGGLLGGAAGAVAMIAVRSLSWRYLDVIALSFPLGLAIGRVGDLILGEHYGPPSDLPWAVIHTDPEASVPSVDVAYHDGGLYEIVLGLIIFAIVWPLRHRFRRATMALWAVVALYGLGRFLMFFYRSDSDSTALGINVAQLTSLGFVVAAGIGAYVAWKRSDAGDAEDSPIAAAVRK